jgi:hypothetical protein
MHAGIVDETARVRVRGRGRGRGRGEVGVRTRFRVRVVDCGVVDETAKANASAYGALFSLYQPPPLPP